MNNLFSRTTTDMPVPCAGYLSSLQIIHILSKVKLLRYPAQGTGISVVVRENKLSIFYQQLNY
jgi:hypothetical protein